MDYNLTFAGVGSAFTTAKYYQSSFVIEKNNKRLVVDMGGDARFSLAELGATNATIGKWLDGVYITHLHNDHCGGLEFLAFCTYFSKSPKPKLFISKDLVDDLWSILKIGLDSIEGEKVSLDTYFEVHPVDKKFEWEGIDFRLVKAEHVWANDVLMPVYGLVFEDIYFSSDTIMCDTVKAEYKKAKLIFHDCETNPWKSKVHAHYDDLKLLPETIKNKMWLYHYSPNPVQKPKEDGFCGFIEKGQKFDG